MTPSASSTSSSLLLTPHVRQHPHTRAPVPRLSPPQAPPDPIIGVNDSYRADTDPRKLNLGVGAYRTEVGPSACVVGGHMGSL